MKRIMSTVTGLLACWFVTSSFATGVCGLPPSGYDTGWCSCFLQASEDNCKSIYGSNSSLCTARSVDSGYKVEPEGNVRALCTTEDKYHFLPDGVSIDECTSDIDYYDAYSPYNNQAQCPTP